MTKSAASRLRSFIGCDGLDQARVIVPRSRPARSAYHILLRVMREEGVELGRVRGLLPEPLWPSLGRRTTGIRLWISAHSS